MFNKTEMLRAEMGGNERWLVPKKKGFMSSDEVGPLEPGHESRWGDSNRHHGFTLSNPLSKRLGKPMIYPHLISSANRRAAMRAAKWNL